MVSSAACAMAKVQLLSTHCVSSMLPIISGEVAREGTEDVPVRRGRPSAPPQGSS